MSALAINNKLLKDYNENLLDKYVVLEKFIWLHCMQSIFIKSHFVSVLPCGYIAQVPTVLASMLIAVGFITVDCSVSQLLISLSSIEVPLLTEFIK